MNPITAAFASAVIFLCGIFLKPLAAAEIHELNVERLGDDYVVSMVFDANATLETVHALLTDFEHLDKLNPNIISSELLPTNDPALTRVRTHAKGCAFSLCIDMVRVEDVSEGPDHALYAEIVPNSGDIRSGKTYCAFEEHEGFTRVRYRSTLALDFFIPPVLGPLIVARGLKQELRRTVENLEKLSLAAASPEPGSHQASRHTRPLANLH